MIRELKANELSVDKARLHREKVLRLEVAIKEHPANLGEHPFPLKHTFTPGIYCREMVAPAGMVIVGKLHKTEHPVFLLSGEMSLITDDGSKKFQGPCMMISKAGEKRAAYTHTECVWVNIHANPDDDTNLETIEHRLVIDDDAQLQEWALGRLQALKEG